MKLLHVNPIKHSIEEIELKIEANTFYTFFSSLLIDELPTIQNHIIYTDANALSDKKTPYFIADQLVIGEALILGQNGLEDCDVTISKETLSELINYDVSQFYLNTLDLLSQTEINLYRTFELIHNSQNVQLDISSVISFFNIADEKTKEYFLTHLKNTIENKEEVVAFMQKMAKAALQAAG